MNHYTVLGADGFIGKVLSDYLKKNDGSANIYLPKLHKGISFEKLIERDLGHVFYCIGLTANFRSRPFDTVEAHICLLKRILEKGRFDSLTYLSSTRVYEAARTTCESEILHVSSSTPSHLYNLSKLMGESLCFASGLNTKIVRLSNVYGSGMPQTNFLGQVFMEASGTGQVRFLTAPNSSKDYISVHDVVHYLTRIALHGRKFIYNLASGENVSNAEIASLLEHRGIKASFDEGAPEWSFPVIDISQLRIEFGAPQRSLRSEFDSLLSCYRQQ